MSAARSSDIDPSHYPRTYGVSVSWRSFLFFCSVFCLGISALLGWQLASDAVTRDPVAVTIIVILFGAQGLYMVAVALVSKVVLTADAIEVRGLFRTRRLARADIKGRALLKTGQGVNVLTFYPVDTAQKKLSLSLIYRSDKEMKHWIETLPDLLKAEQEQAMAEFLKDSSDGASPHERRTGLAQAKKIAKVISVAAGVAGFAGYFLPSYGPLMAFLAALPWIAFAVAARAPALYTLNEHRKDVRAGLGTAVIVPGLILLIRSLLDFHLLDWNKVHAGAAAIALLMSFFAAKIDRKLVDSKIIFLILALLIPYGYGAIIMADALPDTASPQVFETKVISKHYTSGKGAHAELNIAPWGPDAGGDVAVSGWLYKSISPGDKVCAYLHPGALDVPWYDVGKCPGTLTP